MTATSPDSASQKTRFANALAARPAQATGALVLGNGAVLWGLGLGAEGQSLGEVCFNTSMSGYQEILMDPSYAGQIITFTFPHIGNVGTNDEDIEAHQVFARGCVLRCDITRPSNFRAAQHLLALEGKQVDVHEIVVSPSPSTPVPNQKVRLFVSKSGSLQTFCLTSIENREIDPSMPDGHQ